MPTVLPLFFVVAASDNDDDEGANCCCCGCSEEDPNTQDTKGKKLIVGNKDENLNRAFKSSQWKNQPPSCQKRLFCIWQTFIFIIFAPAPSYIVFPKCLKFHIIGDILVLPKP